MEDRQPADSRGADEPGRAAALELSRKIEHVLEPAMRRHLVAERMTSLVPRQACALMGAVLRLPPETGLGWRELRDLLHDLLLSHPDGTPCGFSYAFRRDLYGAAERAGDDEVRRILRSTPAGREPEAARRLPADLVDVPLGRRRSLARGDDEHWLELLALDSDPIVIRHLLRNPRIREPEVVHIAAMRPVSVTTLHEVAASSRWARSIRVRTALARNPYTPVDLAAKLLVSLPLAVLREMRRDPDLHPETQGELQRELERRA